ncbi:MAG: hypothetical protein Q4A25_01490 [Candidatus Saccharibacteria bacterium]|nr:hypothetical protein [Candidatus Saccharibacteria bacterium]
MDFWKKITAPLEKDLEWNFPEQKSGTVAIIGGNNNNFSYEVKLAEYLSNNYSVEKVETYFPDELKKSLPNIPGINFLESTESGSFKKSEALNSAFQTSDFTILPGDFSKNSATNIAISEALKTATSPVVLSRDAIDLLTPNFAEFIEDHQLFVIASMAQLQKIFRSLLYPKMILLKAPLMQTAETLHKFTLSYENCTIITILEGQIVLASQGKVVIIPLEKTKLNALTFFTGNLPGDITAYNLWNPGKPLEASASALFH